MKKYVRSIICVILSLLMLAPTTAFAAGQVTTSIYNGLKYTQNEKFNNSQVLQGIDVSNHNGDLNWATIKKSGTDFAILRAGCRGYAEAGTLIRDTKFEEYYTQAKAQNIPLGAYIYSQAISTKEAVEEADYILNIIAGKEFELPIVFDYEFASPSDSRLKRRWNNGTLNKTKMTDIALAFCNRIRQAGYQPMVYASKSFFYDQLDYKKLEGQGIKIWVAHYTSQDTASKTGKVTDYKGKYEYFQYTSSGKIPGISSKVFDANFWYKDNTENEQNQAINPPVQVQNLKSTLDANYNMFLSWSYSQGAEGYYIEKKNPDGSFAYYDYTTQNAYQFENADESAGVYRVTPYNTSLGNIQVGPSSQEIECALSLSKPTLSYSSTSNKITLKWNGINGATGYQIFKYNYTTKTYSLINTVDGVTSATFENLSTNAKYRYKVTAFRVKADGNVIYSSRSEGLTCYTKPRAPKLKSAKYSSSKKIKVNWAKTSDVSGYQIQWSTKSDFSSNKKSVTVKSSVRTKTISTAKAKKNYYVRIRSYKTRDGVKYYSAWTSAKKVYVKK